MSNDYQITIFNSEKTNGKLPLSPYNDNTFVFQNITVQNNLAFYQLMVKYFILNIPLTLDKPIRTFRRKKNLELYYTPPQNYLILDIDNIKTKADKQSIIAFFKDYKCILGESKSYNNIDNFNLKGVLFTEDIQFNDLKLAISGIHHELHSYCSIDECASRKASLNAPINKNNVLLNNENGKLYTFSRTTTEETIKEIKAEYIDGTCIEVPIAKLQDIEADTIEKLCLKTFQMLGFVALRNNENKSITFKHDTEKKSPGGYFWFSESPYTMHHANSTKTINLFDNIRKLPQAKELMKKDLNYENEFQNFNIDTTVIPVQEKYLEVTPEIEQSIQQFITDKDGLYSIRSPMGTGKSTIIKRIIEEAHNEDMKVLIITNRISVAEDFSKKYDMKLYNKDKYNSGDSLICQFDSLWKYNLREFDVIIMDEFISLMMHSRNNLGNSSINIAKFFGAFNKKLVIADAFLTGYENFLLQNKTKNVYMLDNQYRDSTMLYKYEDFNYFVQALLYTAKNNKITVSATSLSFINSLEQLLKTKGLKVVTLTASTPCSTKELIYKLFEQETHDKYDVLIYSPTLTVGVSNLNNVNYHYHYDSSRSTDVISSIQMIKRTRKSKEIHMFVRERTNYIKTSYNAIRDEYMGNIGKNIDQNFLFDIDDYGESKLSNLGKKAIKIDTFRNILEFNHAKAVQWMLKYHFLNEPRVVNKTFQSNILTSYQKEIKNNADKVLTNNIEQFLELNNIQKNNILEDESADKVLRTLAEIDHYIKDCQSNIKLRILNLCLKDRNFIDKCRYFKVAFNYTKKIWDVDDVKYRINRSVLDNNTDDLHFYNILLSYGQQEIYDDYVPKTINKNPHLKAILDKCGYKLETGKNTGSFGARKYIVDRNIKELYGFIE